jgi:succinate-acetate transporter protein
MITGPVGFVLGLLGRSSRLAMRFAYKVFGTAWALVTYLAIPVMVQERRGSIPSLKRSGALFRNTWGETALSEVGVRVVGAQLAIAIIVIAIVLIRVLGESVFTALVLLAVAACLVGIVFALEAIYRAALYVFAAEGVVPEPFGGPDLEDIWQVK